MSWFLLIAALWAAPLGPSIDALPPPPPDEHVGSPVFVPSASPCHGQVLRAGEQLPLRPDWYQRKEPGVTFGRPETIFVVSAAAEELAWRLPNADPISVGHISAPGGGPFPGHRSHRTGLDVDLGLFWGEGQQHLLFQVVQPDELDAAATWALIDALLSTGMVERILLDRKLVARAREYAISSGDVTRAEAERMMPSRIPRDIWSRSGVVHHEKGHQHHMHVRVRCQVAGANDDGDTG